MVRMGYDLRCGGERYEDGLVTQIRGREYELAVRSVKSLPRDHDILNLLPQCVPP